MENKNQDELKKRKKRQPKPEMAVEAEKLPETSESTEEEILDEILESTKEMPLDVATDEVAKTQAEAPKKTSRGRKKVTKDIGEPKMAPVFDSTMTEETTEDSIVEDVEIEEINTKAEEIFETEEEIAARNHTKAKETIYIETITPRQEAKQAKILERQARQERKKRAKLIKQKQKSKGPKAVVRYETDIENGLSSEIVKDRIENGLNNQKQSGSTKSIKKIIFSNLFTFFNLLTLTIAGWLISVAAFKDLVFVLIVVINIVMGIIQEIKAKNIIDKLSILSAPSAMVIRDGADYEVAVTDVVLDDLLVLENGNQICSDSVVVSGTIEVNESLLTGESDAIVKKVGDTLLSGSFVVSGNCRAKVEKVGKDNYIEILSSQAKKYVKPKSDLWRSLKLIITFMAFVIIPIGIALFVMQYWNGSVDYPTAVRKTAGAMVGMIPSGLYLLTTVALMLGVIRLSQNNVLVQEVYCIEMLARVNVLCLDKTGTITDGTMSVKNNVDYEMVHGLNTKNIISAYLNALNDKNLTSLALEERFGRGKRIKFKETIAFSSSRKYSAVTFERYDTFLLGAPEFIMKKNYSLIEHDVNKYATSGYRVILLAHTSSEISNGALPEDAEIKPVSLILIEDNVRPDAVDTINYFKRSGVEVKVISGDNPLTVSKVSERAGIKNASKYISLDGLTDADVVRAAAKYTVFGRVSPIQKRLLVRTLKDLGKVVAMTGDGVNDILALKEADCSIAVASGSEAARNVSHLVLLDSNFASMPKVVREGRRVINNVAKVACLFLTKTIFSFLLAIQAINSGGIYPISTSQLFMIDLLCIGIPSFFLVWEPNNNQVSGKFLFNIIKGALPGAICILLISLVVFGLQETLNMDFQVSSTIIVITATFTCMMVLFEVCQPFNLLRKALCGSVFALFIFATILLPSYFEFSPIVYISDYYDKDLVVETVPYWPEIEVSKEGYYVIDGRYTKYAAIKNDSTHNVLSSNNGLLIINGVQTNYEIKLPEVVSLSKDDFFVVNGKKSSVPITKEELSSIELTVSSDGTVMAKGQKVYNVLPEVSIGSDGYYRINNISSQINAEDKEIKSVAVNQQWQLLINNKLVNYFIPVPQVSISNDDYLVVNGEVSNVSLSEVSSKNPTITVSDTCYYRFDGVLSTTYIITPVITTSLDSYLVISGELTPYKYAGYRNEMKKVVTSDGYLKVNGVKTDYKLKVDISYGGQVQRLPLECILLMICLCLVSRPLMKLLKAVVPWGKRQLKNIAVFISRF